MTTYHPQSYYHHYNSTHGPHSKHITPTYEPRDYYPKQRAPPPPPPLHNEKYNKRRSSNRCCDAFCCGCFTCCPRPCRWFTCILFLLLAGFIIAVAALIVLFKKPSVKFTEIKGTPSFDLKGSNATVVFNLDFAVDNPNFESMMFKSIDTVLYYDSYTTAIGNGHLEDIYIAANSVSDVTYPMSISVDVSQPEQQKMFTKLMSQCGLGSDGNPDNIKLRYEIIATASVFGVGLPLPYNNHASVPCPISNQASILNELSTIIGSPKLASAIPKAAGIMSALPTAVLKNLPIPSGVNLESIISGLYPVPTSSTSSASSTSSTSSAI